MSYWVLIGLAVTSALKLQPNEDQKIGNEQVVRDGKVVQEEKHQLQENAQRDAERAAALRKILSNDNGSVPNMDGEQRQTDKSDGYEVPEELQCSICYGLPVHPVCMACCGSCMCQSCHDDAQRANNACPMCRNNENEIAAMRYSLVMKDPRLRDSPLRQKLLAQTNVRCPHHPSCNWRGTYAQREEHVDNCDSPERVEEKVRPLFTAWREAFRQAVPPREDHRIFAHLQEANPGTLFRSGPYFWINRFYNLGPCIIIIAMVMFAWQYLVVDSDFTRAMTFCGSALNLYASPTVVLLLAYRLLPAFRVARTAAPVAVGRDYLAVWALLVISGSVLSYVGGELLTSSFTSVLSAFGMNVMYMVHVHIIRSLADFLSYLRFPTGAQRVLSVSRWLERSELFLPLFVYFSFFNIMTSVLAYWMRPVIIEHHGYRNEVVRANSDRLLEGLDMGDGYARRSRLLYDWSQRLLPHFRSDRLQRNGITEKALRQIYHPLLLMFMGAFMHDVFRWLFTAGNYLLNTESAWAMPFSSMMKFLYLNNWWLATMRNQALTGQVYQLATSCVISLQYGFELITDPAASLLLFAWFVFTFLELNLFQWIEAHNSVVDQ